MKHSNSLKTVAIVALLSYPFLCQLRAQQISVNFVGGGFISGAPDVLAADDFAGVFAAPFWNNVADNAALDFPGPSVGSATDLVDDSGALTTAAISWIADNTWSTQSTANDANSRMMKGYLDNGLGDSTIISVTGVPYSTYSIYVYFSDDNGDIVNGTVGSYSLGSQTIYGRDPGNFFQGNFVRATGTNPTDPNATGNYLVFSGVTGSSFTLTASPANFYQRAPVNGLSIVAGCQVDVNPPFYQYPLVPKTTRCPLTPAELGNERWACDDYAGSGQPIRKKGCALSVLAMALRFANVTTIPGTGTALDPGSLNTYMIDNNLYTHDPNPILDNNVLWDQTARSIPGRALKLKYDASFPLNSTDALDEILCKGFPVIVQVQSGGHYVLVTGKQGNTYSIIDPGHRENTDLLQAYGGSFDTIIGYIADPPGDISGLDLNVGNAAELLVVDGLGRRTGFDHVTGTVLSEIPQAVHFVDALADDETGAPPNGSSHSIDIFQPASGNYQVILTGLGLGGYNFSVHTYSQDGTAQPPLLIQGTADAGSTAKVSLSVETAPNGTTLALVCPSDLTLPNDPGQCSAIVSFGTPSVFGGNGTVTVACNPPSGSTFPLGTTTVNCTATDSAGNAVACSFNVIVNDAEPPIIASLTSTPSVLNARQIRLMPIKLNMAASDNCGPVTSKIISVTSSDPNSPLPSGHIEPDWIIRGNLGLYLRAFQSIVGLPRIYTVTVESKDSTGNVTTRDVIVTAR